MTQEFMKIYDASGDYHEKDPWLYGFWSEDVNWKGLRAEGYTHVLLLGKVYAMGKFGPLGDPVESKKTTPGR